MVTTKKLLEAIETITQFCREQNGCQNCILRKYAPDHWDCHIDAFDFRDVKGNIEAKKKHHGYID